MAVIDPHARITVDELKDIFATTLTEAQLCAFINSATLVVTEELVSEGLSSDRLKQIELYLSAHFATLNDPRMESEKIGSEYSSKVQGKTAMNLDATFYGQTAKLLDTSGVLAQMGAGLKKASITVISEADW